MTLTISSFHDSIIETITYNWAAKLAIVTGKLCSENEHNFTLKFIDCEMINIPHNAEWGSSSSILELEKINDFEYTIVMQSGDSISIRCQRLELCST
jgi:hypothetical protein